MARAKVVHSDDACTIIFKGNKANPEPSTGIIKFPGGHVEVSRTSDGQYWAHISRKNIDAEAGSITDSRIDYPYELGEHGIPSIPDQDQIEHIAIKIQSRG